MKKVHLTLQGKGGIGKSFVASLIAQYLRSRHDPIVVIDADPVAQTLASYQSLAAERLKLMDGCDINVRNYDPLFVRLIEDDTNFVIDNGPSSFFPLCNYIKESGAFGMIANSGKQVVIHIVITGGQSLYVTLSDFHKLTKIFPDHICFVIWLNPYWGPIEVDGKTFTEFKVFRTNKDRVSGIMELPSSQTFDSDLSDMLISSLMFDEVAESTAFDLFAKGRLLKMKHAIYNQLEAVI